MLPGALLGGIELARTSCLLVCQRDSQCIDFPWRCGLRDLSSYLWLLLAVSKPRRLGVSSGSGCGNEGLRDDAQSFHSQGEGQAQACPLITARTGALNTKMLARLFSGPRLMGQTLTWSRGSQGSFLPLACCVCAPGGREDRTGLMGTYRSACTWIIPAFSSPPPLALFSVLKYSWIDLVSAVTVVTLTSLLFCFSFVSVTYPFNVYLSDFCIISLFTMKLLPLYTLLKSIFTLTFILTSWSFLHSTSLFLLLFYTFRYEKKSQFFLFYKYFVSSFSISHFNLLVLNSP